MIALILGIAFVGFLAWIILQIPMPGPFKNIIIGILCFLLVVWVLQSLGVNTGLPAVRLR